MKKQIVPFGVRDRKKEKQAFLREKSWNFVSYVKYGIKNKHSGIDLFTYYKFKIKYNIHMLFPTRVLSCGVRDRNNE
jgi:methyltransferase-like protein